MKVMSLRFITACAVILSIQGMSAMEQHAALTPQERAHIQALKPYFSMAIQYRNSADIAVIYNQLLEVISVYLQDAYNGTEIQAIAYQELELMRTQVGSILPSLIDDAHRTYRVELLECLQPIFVGMQEEVQLAQEIAAVKVAHKEAIELQQALNESVRTAPRTTTTTTTVTPRPAVRPAGVPAGQESVQRRVHFAQDAPMPIMVDKSRVVQQLERLVAQKTDMQAIINCLSMLDQTTHADLFNQAVDLVVAHAQRNNDHAILGQLKNQLGFMNSRYTQVHAAQQAIIAKRPVSSSDTRVTDAQGIAIAPEVKKSGTWLGFFAKTGAVTATCAAIGAGAWWYLNR